MVIPLAWNFLGFGGALGFLMSAAASCEGTSGVGAGGAGVKETVLSGSLDG